MEGSSKRSVSRLSRFWAAAPVSFKIGACLLLAHVLVAALGAFWAPFGNNQIGTGPPLYGISWVHPFGTDILGRDVFSRVIRGGHIVIILSIAGSFLGLAIGTAVGLTSAYLRGWFDEIIMRIIEAMVGIPYLILALLLVAIAGPRHAGSPVLLVLVIAAVFAPRIARIARAAALDIVSRNYVTAAQMRGEGTASVVLRELLPNTTGTLLVEFALRTGYAPVLVGTLGFLGFGVRPPTPEWGLMISQYRDLILVAPMSLLGPAFFLGSLVVGLNLCTEGLARLLGQNTREIER